MDLLGKEGFLLHASGVLTPSGVMLFMGESGAGKSTTMRMVDKVYTPFSDDCVILRKKGERYVCYQSPWVEKDSSYIKVTPYHSDINRVFVLRKNHDFGIEKITKTDLIQELITNIWIVGELSIINVKAIFQAIQKGLQGSVLKLKKDDSMKLSKAIEANIFK